MYFKDSLFEKVRKSSLKPRLHRQIHDLFSIYPFKLSFRRVFQQVTIYILSQIVINNISVVFMRNDKLVYAFEFLRFDCQPCFFSYFSFRSLCGTLREINLSPWSYISGESFVRRNRS
jgi:hypothetical protein